MMLQIAKKNLRRQLADRLFEAILEGELRPGERLAEVRLARQLGVGQSTLREALQELEYRGLLTKNENRGTFVTKLTTQKVNEIYAVRLELEPLAASLAALHIMPECLGELSRSVEKMRSALAGSDLTEMLRNDLAFHKTIWKLSGNESLERALDLICAPLFAFYLIRFPPGAATEKFPRDFSQDHEEHQVLVRALETRKPEHVRTVFRKTLEIFRKRHVQHVESAGHNLLVVPRPPEVQS